MNRLRWRLTTPVVVLLLCMTATAAEPFRYPEGKHGKGELKYVNGIPVLTVQGKPEEMGEQIGVLVLKPTSGGVIGLFKQFLKEKGLDKALPLVVGGCKALYERFPDHLRKELEAMTKAADVDMDIVLI